MEDRGAVTTETQAVRSSVLWFRGICGNVVIPETF